LYYALDENEINGHVQNIMLLNYAKNLGKLVQVFYRSGYSNTVASHDFASENLSFWFCH